MGQPNLTLIKIGKAAMTHRQWLNVMIISLSVTSLLFLFAHQQLMKTQPDISLNDSAYYALIPNHQHLDFIQFQGQKLTDSSTLKSWQQIVLIGQYKESLRELYTSESMPVSEPVLVYLTGNTIPLMYLLYSQNGTSYLLREKDKILFTLTQEQIQQLL